MRLLFIASLIFCEVLWTSLSNQAEAGTLAIHVTDSDGSPRSDIRVHRYSENWRSIDSKLTDQDGKVFWTDIPAGTYKYRVLENRKDGDFWGTGRIVVPGTGTGTRFQKKSPGIAQIKKPSLIRKGKRDPITITVSNKETYAVSAKIRVRISKPMGKGPRGYEQTQGPVSIRGGESRTFQFNYSPRDTGRNYVLLTAMVFSKYKNEYVRTDTRRSDWYVTVEPGAHRSPVTHVTRPVTELPRPTKAATKQEIRAPVSTEKKPVQESAEEAPIPTDKPTKSIRKEETVPEIPVSPGSSLAIIGVLLSIGIAAAVLILLRARIALGVQKLSTLLKGAKVSFSGKTTNVRRRTVNETETQLKQSDKTVREQVENLEKLLWIKKDETGEIRSQRPARETKSVKNQVEDLEKLLWIKKDEEIED